MKVIGKGLFSTAYKKNNKKALIKSCCPMKEAMALGFFPNSRLFPRVTQVDFQEYEMPLYTKRKSLKKSLVPQDWELYKELKELFESQWAAAAAPRESRYAHWRKAFKTIKNKRARTALLEALDGCANYTQNIGFEVSPRNVAVTESGRLVLLDVFFSIDTMRDVRNRKTNR